jgi:hypothetical protein
MSNYSILKNCAARSLPTDKSNAAVQDTVKISTTSSFPTLTSEIVRKRLIVKMLKSGALEDSSLRRYFLVGSFPR